MIDDSDAYQPLGAGSDAVAWSWSYVRHPTVLFPWFACAALSAFLRDRPQAESPRETPPLRRPIVLSGPRRSEREPARRGESDDEARAA